MNHLKKVLYIFGLFIVLVLQNKKAETNQPCTSDFGECIEGRTSCKTCDNNFEGSIIATCRKSNWIPTLESCVSLSIQNLLLSFKNNPSVLRPVKPFFFGSSLGMDSHFDSNFVLDQQCPVVSQSAGIVRNENTTAGNIGKIVILLNYIAKECFMGKKIQEDSEDLMLNSVTRNLGILSAVKRNAQDYSAIANHILNPSTIPKWSLVPEKNASWVLLGSMHNLALSLVNDNTLSSNISIFQDFLHLKAKTVAEDSDFTFQFNNTGQPVSGEVLIKNKERADISELSAVSIAFLTLGNILPIESENSSVNGLVMSVVLSEKRSTVLLRFEKINKASNVTSHCSAWDGEKEKWNRQACQMQEETKGHAICKCNYSEKYLSFSVMMSPKSINNPVLHYITIIGLSISICSLVLCLIIEAVVWKNITKHKTAYMRHVAIVNIAISLLFGDTWFIVSALIDKTKSAAACISATYFNHFFYLSLFFWMLVLGLLILYRIILVYHDMRRTVMLRISFTIGYGCPLIICIITVAATLSQPDQPYTRQDTCWLNWDESKALFAFVIPVFIIIAINGIIMVIVIIILLRPSLGENPRTHEKSSIFQVGRCVAVLTPLLGLTWGIGIATVIASSSIVFAYLFTILNSLQGLLILILGTLTDRNVRQALHKMLSPAPSLTSQSKNTSNSPQS
ncbi:adhesion G protein-coupled receptor F4-like [Discoglossus pictus]